MKKGAHSASILSSVFKFPLWELVFISVAAAENPNYTLFITSRNGGNMNLYETVKGRVTPQMAAERYDLPVNRSGMACCPFHNDRTPSMKLYPDHFHCFGCGQTGDVIDLTAQLTGQNARDAAGRLATDFGIPMQTGEDTAPRPAKAAQTDQTSATEKAHSAQAAGERANPTRTQTRTGSAARTASAWGSSCCPS